MTRRAPSSLGASVVLAALYSWPDPLERGSARLATLAFGIGYEQAALEWLERLPSYLGDHENP